MRDWLTLPSRWSRFRARPYGGRRFAKKLILGVGLSGLSQSEVIETSGSSFESSAHVHLKKDALRARPSTKRVQLCPAPDV